MSHYFPESKSFRGSVKVKLIRYITFCNKIRFRKYKKC